MMQLRDLTASMPTAIFKWLPLVVSAVGMTVSIWDHFSGNQFKQADLLVRVIPQLADPNPQLRALAVRALSLAGLRPGDLVAIDSALAMKDPSDQVRRAARTTLGHLSANADSQVSSKARSALKQSDVMNVLRDRGLLADLGEAAAYAQGRNGHGTDRAFQRYERVLSILPDETKSHLNSQLLTDGEQSAAARDKERAVRDYSTLFAPFLIIGPFTNPQEAER